MLYKYNIHNIQYQLMLFSFDSAISKEINTAGTASDFCSDW